MAKETRFPHMKKTEAYKQAGEAYFAPEDAAQIYVEGVGDFLVKQADTLFPKKGQEQERVNWVQKAGSLLYKFESRDGILIQSTPYTNTAFSMFVPEHPLLSPETYIEMRNYAESQGQSGAVLGPIYSDLFMNLDGKPQRNETEARNLLDSFAQNGISTKFPRAPRLDQLDLVGDKEVGLVWRLKDNVVDKDITNTADIVPKSYIGKNGLFRGYVDVGGICAGSGLRDSSDYGRVVCYGAEGVALKKAILGPESSSLARRLGDDFLSRVRKSS